MTNSKSFKHETERAGGRPRGDLPALPIYDSMLQCEAATGIPVALQKKAKTSGCEAFQTGSRVHLGPLLRWLFSQGDALAITKGREMFEEFRGLREKIKHDKEAKLTADKGEVTVGLTKVLSTMFASLERMRHEGPPAWKGMGEIEIYEKFGKQIDGLKDELALAFERLEKGENESVS